MENFTSLPTSVPSFSFAASRLPSSSSGSHGHGRHDDAAAVSIPPPVFRSTFPAESILGFWRRHRRQRSDDDDEGPGGRLSVWGSPSTGDADVSIRVRVSPEGGAVLRSRLVFMHLLTSLFTLADLHLIISPYKFVQGQCLLGKYVFFWSLKWFQQECVLIRLELNKIESTWGRTKGTADEGTVLVLAYITIAWLAFHSRRV